MAVPLAAYSLNSSGFGVVLARLDGGMTEISAPLSIRKLYPVDLSETKRRRCVRAVAFVASSDGPESFPLNWLSSGTDLERI